MASRDGGFTVVESVVGMVVLTIFLSIFGGAVVTMYGSSDRSEAVADTAQQLHLAFDRLDTEVRYASFISVPGQDAVDHNNWYVELQQTNVTPATCIQLRVDQVSGQLQQRSGPSGGSPSAWVPLATGVTNGNAGPGATQPFAVTAATSTVRSSQLTVTLVTGEGTGPQSASSTSSVSFTALNTTQTTPTAGLCTGWRP